MWPQEWSFFVDLDRNVLEAHSVNPDGTLRPVSGRQGWADNAWGFDRRVDAEASEVRTLVRGVPRQHWRPCARPDAAECVEEPGSRWSYRLENTSRAPTVCGKVLLVAERTAVPPPNSIPAPPAARWTVVVDAVCDRR
ncbi:hypothetical protein [Saccharothrix australiensis]|uniref:hypothetical protein n=1 Tax=Saccharothrix australiensis TaxID=2072 RepID=UPI000EAEDEB9|nr:hypothetical protein [Saccharothrix australiensis]